jgi:hypothetical protein
MSELMTMGNGFGAMPPVHPAQTQALGAREIQEAQGMIISAKMYPRDEASAVARIEKSCERLRLAEQAMYSFPRGGQTITGASIRLAEVIAQFWGNLDTGWKIVDSSRIDETGCVAWAWDLESNMRKRIEFVVKHLRETKSGVKVLTDSRDIYELCANQASRRQRNCILAVVPGDVVDVAVEACERTLQKAGSIEEKRKKMLDAFKEIEVTAEDLEAKFKKKITAINDAEYLQARKIYQSIRDGVSKKEDWFPTLHDPAKTNAEQKAAGKEAPKTNPTPSANADKEKSINEFIKLFDEFKINNQDPEKYLGKKANEILLMSPNMIDAHSEKLEQWLAANNKEQPK